MNLEERIGRNMKTIREIGSEFWTGCTPHSNEVYSMRPERIYKQHPYKVVETLSGRTSLDHIVEILVKQGKKTAYLPSYCCHTMIEPFMSHGMKVHFYDVEIMDFGLHRLVEESVEYDTILLMDYFGHTDTETFEIASKEKQKEKTVIYDATHSLYSLINTTPYDFIYGSYRKWVDINCGFLAWKEDLSKGDITQNGDEGDYARKRQLLFDMKASFMGGGSVEKKDFLPLINDAESILENQYHHQLPDKRSMEVLRTTDASFMKFRRMENARVLTEGLNSLNNPRVWCLNPLLNANDVPLFVPIIVAIGHRDKLRQFLIEKEIYCPVHWPKSDIHKRLKGSELLFECELSLICDQRYDKYDMARIVDTIGGYLIQ